LSNELVLCNLTVGDAGPVELIGAAAAGGFDSVNLWLSLSPGVSDPVTARRAPADVVGNPELIRAIRERCKATGVRIFTASAGFISPSFDRVRLTRTLEAIAELGCARFSIVGWDDDPARLAQHFGELCTHAATFSIAVQLEFMAYSTIKTLAAALELVETAANAQVILDTLHFDRAGSTLDEVRRLEPGRIGSVQISDAPRRHPPLAELRVESRASRLYPGDGELPLRELMLLVPEDIAVEVETPVAADAQLPIDERARRAGAKTRAFLAALDGAR
jgi:sugar phosphate isomerase/epimerase